MATYSIMLDPKHPAKKDGTKIVVLRITNNRTRHYINLGLTVKPENWQDPPGRFKKFHNPLNYKELNYHLTEYLANTEKLLSELQLKNIPFSLDHFKTLLFGPTDVPNVNEFFDSTIETMKGKNEIGNSLVYKHAKNALTRFTDRENLSFQEITPSLLEALESHLIKEGCSGNTIHNYMRTIRALYNRAIESGFANQEIFPFYNKYTRKGYRFSRLQKATTKRALSLDELEKLNAYQPKPLSQEEDAKLLFMFSYFTWGMNMVDILKLKWDKNIQENQIVYSRTKTRHTKNLQVPILPPTREILNHFRNYTTGNSVFPFIDENLKDPIAENTRVRTVVRETNRVLKEIGKKLGINTPLST